MNKEPLYFFRSASGNVFSDVMTLQKAQKSLFAREEDWTLVRILDSKDCKVEVTIKEV